MTPDRIQTSLEWLMVEISASREEFQAGQQPDGDDVLQGLISHGYVRERAGRYAVSDAGQRRLEACHG